MTQNPAPRRKGREIDWPAIEAGYRAGLAVRALARKHAVSPSAIHRRARKDGWGRRPPSRPVPVAPRPAGTSGTAEELARLRALAAILRDRLERVMDGARPDIVLGARESPAGLLLKLCRINEKILVIERRIAGDRPPTPARLSEQDRDILDRFKRRYGVS